MKSRYDLIKKSHIKSPKETNYPDIMTNPLYRFRFVEIPTEYVLTAKDIERPDVLAYNLFGVSEFDDILFWINGIENIRDVEPGTTILVPTKKEITRFYNKYHE